MTVDCIKRESLKIRHAKNEDYPTSVFSANCIAFCNTEAHDEGPQEDDQSKKT